MVFFRNCAATPILSTLFPLQPPFQEIKNLMGCVGREAKKLVLFKLLIRKFDIQ